MEENHRKVTGATAHDISSLDQTTTWSEKVNADDYQSCPENIKKLIQETELDELVYWKLKEQLEKKSSLKQNEILKGVIADVERPLFAIVLSKTNGNQSKAAEILGCNRNTLHRKLKEFLINPKDIKRSLRSTRNRKEMHEKIQLSNSYSVSSQPEA